MDFDPLRDGAITPVSVRSPYRPGTTDADSVMLGFGERFVIGGVAYQAVPFALSEGSRDSLRHPLVDPDPGHRPVPIGSMLLRINGSGEVRLADPGETCTASGPAVAGSSAETRIRLGDALRPRRDRRVEATGHYLAAVETRTAIAGVAHLRLAEWQLAEDFAFAQQSAVSPAPVDVLASSAAHLRAAAAGHEVVRRRAGEIALTLGPRLSWPSIVVSTIDAIASTGRARGDGDWAAQLLARAAAAVVTHDRSRALRWSVPAIESQNPDCHELGCAALARAIDAARVTADGAILDAAAAALGRSALAAPLRGALVSRLDQARSEMRSPRLDALLINVRERIGDPYDLQLADDLRTLAAAGGRWRDGLAAMAVDHAAGVAARRAPIEELDRIYVRVLNVAIVAADAAGESGSGDAYGLNFVASLGKHGPRHFYQYVHRGLGADDVETRCRALDLARPLYLVNRGELPRVLRDGVALARIGTGEARLLMQALGLEPPAPDDVRGGDVALTGYSAAPAEAATHPVPAFSWTGPRFDGDPEEPVAAASRWSSALGHRTWWMPT